MHVCRKLKLCEKAQKKERKGCKNDSKIELWAPRGRNFAILGAFLRGPIFDEFSIGKKSAKIAIRSGKMRKEAIGTSRDQWVGGGGGACGRRILRIHSKFLLVFLITPMQHHPAEVCGGFSHRPRIRLQLARFHQNPPNSTRFACERGHHFFHQFFD